MSNCIKTLCFLIIILSSCTKSDINTEIVLNPEIEKPNSFQINQLNKDSVRLALLNPPVVDLPCTNIPAIIIPKINVGESIELIYAQINGYFSDSSISPKAIKWIVNGETMMQLTSELKLPYATGTYDFEVLVFLKDDQQLFYNFGLDVSDNMVLDIDGYINTQFCQGCLTMVDPFDGVDNCCYDCCFGHGHPGITLICPIF